MQRLVEYIQLLAAGGAVIASTNCNHGSWNATADTCDCDSGWSTDPTNQDILGGTIVYCNSQASTPAPGNTTAATATSSASTRTVWIIVGVVAAAVVIIAGIIIFCCCRRRRSQAVNRKQEREQQQEHLEQQQQQLQLRELASAAHQRHLAELQLRQQMELDEEAEWNREAMLCRQRWNARQPWEPRTYDGDEDAQWSGSRSTDPHLLLYEEALQNSLTPHSHAKRQHKIAAACAEPAEARVRSAAPQAGYSTADRRMPTSARGSESSVFTSTSDECIYIDYSDSPPPPLRPSRDRYSPNAYTSPRCIEPFNFHDPY